MNSPFASLLIALQEYITIEVPAIKWIDQDYGQLENYETRPPVDWPCLLIDFENFEFEDGGEGLQFASGNVLFRLGFPAFSASHNLTPSQWKEQSLAYYDIEWALFKALHGVKLDKYGYLMRVSSGTEKREDTFIRVRALRYSISFEDFSATPEYETTQMPPLNITT